MPQGEKTESSARVRVTRVGQLKSPWVPKGSLGARSLLGEMFPEGARCAHAEAGDAAGTGHRAPGRAGRGRGGRRAGSRLRGAAPLQCPGSPGGGDGGARRQQRGSPAETIAGRAAAPRPAAPAARAPRPRPHGGARRPLGRAAAAAAGRPAARRAARYAELPRGDERLPSHACPARRRGAGGAAGRGAQGPHGAWGCPAAPLSCPLPARGPAPRRHRGVTPAEPRGRHLPLPLCVRAPRPVPPAVAEGDPSGEGSCKAGQASAPRVSRRAAGTLGGLARCGSAAFRAAPERRAAPIRTLVARREQRAPEGDSLPLAFSPCIPFSSWNRVLVPSSRLGFAGEPRSLGQRR